MVVMVGCAVATKVVETRAAASWVAAPGRIVRSGIAQQRHQFSGEQTTVKNVLDIAYEFKANGRTQHGDRVSFDDIVGAALEAAVKRYPVGAPVTVYYDPADPSRSVLERGVPQFTSPDVSVSASKKSGASGSTGKGCAAIVALVVAAIVCIIVFGKDAVGWLEARKIDNAPFVIAISCFGLLMLVGFIAFRRHLKKAMAWPAVPGRIVSSEVEVQQKYENGKSRTWYSPAVEFAYSVNGNEYRSRQIRLGVTVSGGKGYAEKVVARYPEGAQVEVHYDPENPETAALENSLTASWLVFFGAMACFAVAAVASGIFR